MVCNSINPIKEPYTLHSKIIFGDSRSTKEEKTLSQALRKHKEINDRFTFDDLFRLLLRSGFTHREAKDVILINCSLSALVFQTRIENRYYLKISEQLSKDLLELRNEILCNKLSQEIQEIIDNIDK